MDNVSDAHRADYEEDDDSLLRHAKDSQQKLTAIVQIITTTRIVRSGIQAI